MATKEMKIVDPRKKVTVYATEKARHHNVGSPVKMGELLAEKLVKQGKMTYEKPSVKKELTPPVPPLK